MRVGLKRHLQIIQYGLLSRAKKGEDVCFQLALDQRYLRRQLPDVVAKACRIKGEAIARRVQHCQLLSFLIKFCSQLNYQWLYVADHVVNFGLLTVSQCESSGYRPEALQLQVATQYAARRTIGHPPGRGAAIIAARCPVVETAPEQRGRCPCREDDRPTGYPGIRRKVRSTTRHADDL